MRGIDLIEELEQALYDDALEFEKRGDFEGSTTALELALAVGVARNEESIERALRGGFNHDE